MGSTGTDGGRGWTRRLASTLSYRADRQDLLYLVAVGLGAPAAALVGLSVAATVAGPDVASGASGLGAATLLFVATVVVFEAGWYAGHGTADRGARTADRGGPADD